ncbi:MAG TPA: hypothetical protein VK074_00085 [Fodinibius sp.]|nr:hypothetical protein [Fodinibius sp.]
MIVESPSRARSNREARELQAEVTSFLYSFISAALQEFTPALLMTHYPIIHLLPSLCGGNCPRCLFDPLLASP